MKKMVYAVAIAMTVMGSASAMEAPKYTLGVENYNETYIERDAQGGKFMQEKGTLNSLAGSATIKLNESDEVVVSGRYSEGESDYTGAYQGGTYGDLQFDGISRKSWAVEGVYKRALENDMKVGVGVGHRFLEDSLEALAGGYNRENKLTYGIVSLEKSFKYDADWTMTPSIAYKHVFKGEQKSVGTSFSLTHNQPRGHGFDLALTMEREYSGKTFYVTPFYRFWSMADSDTVYVDNGSGPAATLEPRNKTRELGIGLGMKF